MHPRLTIPAFLLLLLLLLLSSCSGRQAPPPAGQVIDLSGIWDKPEEILLSSIATDIEYIPLETKPECLLGDPDQLRVTLTAQYICVNSGGVKLFDRKGHFLRQIGNMGEGPQEYLSGSRYVVDEEHSRIHILDAGRKRVITFGLDGGYQGVFSVGPEGFDIFFDRSGRIGIFFLSENPDPAYEARVEWHSTRGTLLKTIPVYKGRPRGAGWNIAAHVYQLDDRLYFNENPWDTIYRLENDRSWEPAWIIRVGPRRMPPEISMDISRFSAELDRYVIAKPGAETDRYLFLTCTRASADGLLIYDKKNRTARYINQELFGNNSKNFLVNDLDRGLPLRLSLMTGDRQPGDRYVSLVSPLELLQWLKDHPDADGEGSVLQQLARGLREDDNPVVMVVKLKELGDVH